MGTDGQEPSSLALSKAEPFGEALRRAIKQEFRFAKELAKKMGVTEGWISQLVNGKEHASSEVMKDIVSCFKTIAVQEELHDAWVADEARLDVYDGRLWDVTELQEQIETLVAAGRIDRALRMASLERQNATDPVMWQNMSERVVQLNLRLGRSAPAYQEVEEMRKRAEARSDQMDILTALWMRGNVLRLIDTVSFETLTGAHREALGQIGACRPKSAEGKALLMNRTASLYRDHGLNALILHERRLVGDDALPTGLDAVATSLKMAQTEDEVCLALEVRGRLQAASGDVFNAEETLEQLLEKGASKGTELDIKSLLTKARIHERRKERDAAIDALNRAVEWCVNNSDLHHLRVADRRLLGLLQGL